MERRILEHTLVCSFNYDKMFCKVIRMKLANQQQLKQIYQLFENSFIPSELRPYDAFSHMFYNHDFQIYIEEQDSQVIAALIVWEFQDYIFLENFAVDQHLRGQGIGGVFLEKLKDFYPNYDMILEVEEDKNDLTHRRIQFYQRHQWLFNDFHYQQPSLRENMVGEELYIMSYPSLLSEEQFLKRKKELFHKVYQYDEKKESGE